MTIISGWNDPFFCKIVLTGFTILLSIGVPTGSVAQQRLDTQQSRAQEEATLRLRKPVALKLGSVTLHSVLDEIAKQTGVPIEAAEELRSRRLIVQMEHLSGQAALGTLAQINDWQLYQLDNGGILVARRPIKLPKTLSDVPVAIRSCLPADYRRFLGMDETEQSISSIDQHHPTEDSPLLKAVLNSHKATSKIDQAKSMLARQLFQSLEPTVEQGQPFAFNRLSPAWQQAVADFLNLTVLGTMMSSLSSNVIYDGGLAPYQLSSSNAVLSLNHGNGFMIGTTTTVGRYQSYTGFGIAIPILTSTEAPRVPPNQLQDAHP